MKSSPCLSVSALCDRQIVDHAMITGSLAGDAYRVQQIPFTRDESAQHHSAIFDRYADMFVVEIRIAVQRGRHALLQILVRRRIPRASPRSAAAHTVNDHYKTCAIDQDSF